MKNDTTQNIEGYLNQLANNRGVANLQSQFKRDYTYSDGLKINLEIIEKDRNAPTIVFIPGVAVYALCYAELLSKLAEQSGFNVIGFDPRGHGFSEGERGDYTLQDLVKDSQAVITYAIENYNGNVSLMGTRQGGIAALYAAAADDRISSIICHNLADFSDRKSRRQVNFFPGYKKVLKPFVMGLGRLFPKMSIDIKRNLNVPKEDLKNIGSTLEFMAKDPLVLKRMKAKTIRSFLTTKPAKAVEQIDTPIFVLQSENDRVFPLEYTKKVYEKLQCKKKMQVFNGLSTSMMTENVKELLPALLSWLTEIHNNELEIA